MEELRSRLSALSYNDIRKEAKNHQISAKGKVRFFYLIACCTHTCFIYICHCFRNLSSLTRLWTRRFQNSRRCLLVNPSRLHRIRSYRSKSWQLQWHLKVDWIRWISRKIVVMPGKRTWTRWIRHSQWMSLQIMLRTVSLF